MTSVSEVVEVLRRVALLEADRESRTSEAAKVEVAGPVSARVEALQVALGVQAAQVNNGSGVTPSAAALVADAETLLAFLEPEDERARPHIKCYDALCKLGRHDDTWKHFDGQEAW